MKKVATLLYLLLVLPSIAFSQATFRNGFIILKNGDKLEGQVNDLEWSVGPKEVEFRKEGQPVKKFTVNDVISFSTDRPAMYESHSIQYDGDDQSIRNLPFAKEANELKKDKLFLKVIVNSSVGLLHFQEANGRNHFFIRHDTTVTELLKRNYQSNAANSLATNQKYKQQLILITNDCQAVQSRIKNLNYIESDLYNVFVKINECKGSELIPIWSGKTTKKSFNAGITFQPFVNSTIFAFGIAKSKMSEVNFGGGIFIEFYDRKRPNRISYYNELVYRKVNQSGTYYTGSDASIEYTRIKLINALRFSYPAKSGGRFFWNVGLGTGVRKNTLLNGQSSDPNLADYSSDFELGLVGGVGKTFSLFNSIIASTELRYEIEDCPLGNTGFALSQNVVLGIQVYLK